MGEDNPRATLEQLLDKLDKEWSGKNTNAGWEKVDDGLMTLTRARGLLEQLDENEDTEKLRERLDKLDGLVAAKVSTILPAGPAPPPGKNPILDLDRYVIKDEMSPSSSTSTVKPTPKPKPASSKVIEEEEYVPYQVNTTQNLRQRKAPSTTLIQPTRGPESSQRVQEEISHELAQMAGQLKRNAMHFSSSLEKDKGVMEAADTQLNGNFDKMQKTQTATKTMSSKRSGTTWMVLGIVLGVGAVFFFMVLLIRAT